MSSDINLEKIYMKCRVCLNKGDVNIWDYKVSLKRQPEVAHKSNFCTDDVIQKSFDEIMDIFFNSHELLNYTDEFPLLCWQCLEDLKFCYTVYEKMKFAKVKLENLYQQSLNECIEEEYLTEETEENVINEITETNIFETLSDDQFLNLPQYEFVNDNGINVSKKSICYKKKDPDKNDSFIVTQFVPETVNSSEMYISTQPLDNDGMFQPPQQLLTVNLKAVEVKDLKNLDKLETSQSLNTDIIQSAVYICQYCPQAFAKSDYLKTHVQKSHVCKFCTQPFRVTEDLYKHIRETHTENKCAICHKLLSSRTNLRHHIKRVHRISLPAKVTLIDFIKSDDIQDNLQNEVDNLQELEATDAMHSNSQYVSRYDGCI